MGAVSPPFAVSMRGTQGGEIRNLPPVCRSFDYFSWTRKKSNAIHDENSSKIVFELFIILFHTCQLVGDIFTEGNASAVVAAVDVKGIVDGVEVACAVADCVKTGDFLACLV